MLALVLLIWSVLSTFLSALIVSEPPAASYRKTVGPPVILASPGPHVSAASKGRLIIVNWNVHVGHGDIPALVAKISNSETAGGFGKPDFVLLLEESFRHGAHIPDATGVNVPRRIAPPDPKTDIQDVARKLGWWLYYAPSMRNGDGRGTQAEDRGNAILSSLPLADIQAIELPFVVQRRVALIATVLDSREQPRLRVAVTHLDTRAPLLQGWIFGGPAARRRQAEEFASAVTRLEADHLPLIVGGDLNTYLGSKSVIDTMSGLAPHADCGDQPTHTWGVRLDHIFASLPQAWNSHCVRGSSTFGSDHYPLILSLNIPG